MSVWPTFYLDEYNNFDVFDLVDYLRSSVIINPLFKMLKLYQNLIFTWFLSAIIIKLEHCSLESIKMFLQWATNTRFNMNYSLTEGSIVDSTAGMDRRGRSFDSVKCCLTLTHALFVCKSISKLISTTS